ncbi:uncharacterized protein LOC142226462 [Haematobia irritans]|uniref:uncharacterized protein LOC142226462 n=1 Tax=Haematobia irritans TaxID=7368 RepID=UPI003F500765
MDNNISRRRSSDAASCCTSVYLSFDDTASTNMGSTTCYRTMEAMSDISAISSLSAIADASEEKNNSTLENQDESAIPSPVKTVKKMEIISNTPLKALPKNILREYKALCSTPSKEQLLKTVDVTRGSEVNRYDDLGVAFLGVEDELPAFFPPPPPQKQTNRCDDNNKENMSDGSTLSVSSSVEITTSVIERKCLYSITNTGSHFTDSCMVEQEEAAAIITDNLEKTPKVMENNLRNVDGAVDGNLDIVMEDDVIVVENVESIQQTEVLCEVLEGQSTSEMKLINDVIKKDDQTVKAILKPTKEKETTKATTATNVFDKHKIPVLKPLGRRSVCEPNLKTNKPSRISTAGFKRQSLLPVIKDIPQKMDVEKEIPMLMNKMLKISNTSIVENDSDIKPNTNEKNEVKPIDPPLNKRRSTMTTTAKARSSLMPTSLGEKRPFRFTQRMSVVVKTTLNSPARKMARKSSMGISGSLTQQQQQRRNVMTSKISQIATTSTKGDNTVRRSVLVNRQFETKGTFRKTLSTVSETKQIRKSMYPTLNKVSEESKLKPPSKMVSSLKENKPQTSKTQENIFTCASCKEKFRIKSLLDAHRRSHEGEVEVKKPIISNGPTAKTTMGSHNSADNKCKYCDKKFALVRALHIHLLQNCSKIPPGEKKKLKFTEMNHVEKAQLPTFSHHGNGMSASSSTHATPHNAVKQNFSKQKSHQFGKSSKESSMENDLKAKQSDSTSSSVSGSQTTIASTNSVQKPKKASAHSGVYRTPSKSVPCHVCKLTFKSILDYTNHSLATHGNNTEKDNNHEEFLG